MLILCTELLLIRGTELPEPGFHRVLPGEYGKVNALNPPVKHFLSPCTRQNPVFYLQDNKWLTIQWQRFPVPLLPIPNPDPYFLVALGAAFTSSPLNRIFTSLPKRL